jgi:hypothetical protein
LTPLFVESLLTLAVKFAVAPAGTVVEVWKSDTLMGGGGGLEERPPHPARRIDKQYPMPRMERLEVTVIDFPHSSK